MRLATALVAVGLALAGCAGGGSGGSSSAATPSGSTPSSAAAGSGPVHVLYAGSLVNLMEKQLGPAFGKATGYTFAGEGGGSDGLANEIKGKVKQADVFISASPATNQKLQGTTNGDWVSWYATFASSPLVIGYNPNSKFAADLKSKPWAQVAAEPGFTLGRTDPATDPKGKLAVQALDQVGLTAQAADQSSVFPETELIGRLQAGQLDAGFFYSTEATSAKLTTIPAAPVSLQATYTLTVVNHAPDQAGAEAFVNYLLSPPGQDILKAAGLQLTTPPKVAGTAAAVPAALHPALPAG
jgi:molybdate/tungstate transport system substrate-binding protein